jgi:hypothetical protein
VAEGSSNREIADLLALSPKTVERHLTNSLAKLGARNRTELAALVHTLGRDMGHAVSGNGRSVRADAAQPECKRRGGLVLIVVLAEPVREAPGEGRERLIIGLECELPGEGPGEMKLTGRELSEMKDAVVRDGHQSGIAGTRIAVRERLGEVLDGLRVGLRRPTGQDRRCAQDERAGRDDCWNETTHGSGTSVLR